MDDVKEDVVIDTEDGVVDCVLIVTIWTFLEAIPSK